MIQGAKLGTLLPHSGRMCLLDEVFAWGDDAIRCRTQTHRQSDNPLRCRAGLPAHCGIEYAGQAMAIHARLTGGVGADTVGYLASLSEVVVNIEWLDPVAAPLEVSARRISVSASGLKYDFAIEAEHQVLLTGTATVFLSGEQAL
jgi:predicted hotdog family 3-hydroxylacyl-ACP dehydratase